MISIRKIGVFGRTYRNLNRYRQILAILFKYGFGDIVEHLKIDQYIEIGLQMISKKKREKVERLSRAERIRMAIEELGPTYIKLGQLLSTRPDLVPIEILNELSKLQDSVSPFAFEEVKEIILEEFGYPLEEIFQKFYPAVIASASIGQVHRAILKNGEMVAVKVQRPKIEKIIEVDLEIMLHLAILMERNIEELTLLQPVKIVEEFAKTIEKELDYTIEATSMIRVQSQFLGVKHLYVPKVFNESSSRRVLTTEFVRGIKISNRDLLESKGFCLKTIVHNGADVLLRQIFQYGFFHADPHPGNIFVLPENIICLLDFGMMGRVSRHLREDFVELVDSIVKENEIKASKILLKLTTWDQDPDIRLLEKDVGDFMGQHLHKRLKDIEISKLLQNLIELASRHRLRIPPEIFLMLKALSSVEGIASLLHPEFDMLTTAKPFIKRVKMDRISGKRIVNDLWDIISQSVSFLSAFPKDLLEITQTIRNKKLTITLEFKDLHTLLSTHDQISNRISFSIIIAALIIGSALIVRSKTPPLFSGFSVIGIIGFVAAAVMGIWLLIAIIKKGKL